MGDKLILKELSRYKIGTFAETIYRNALFYPDREVFKYGRSMAPALATWNKHHPHILVWTVALLGLASVFAVRPVPYWWLSLTVSGLTLWLLAERLAFRLFIPQRYLVS